jgi:hypothetical protein
MYSALTERFCVLTFRLLEVELKFALLKVAYLYTFLSLLKIQ